MKNSNLNLIESFDKFQDVPERKLQDIYPGFSDRFWQLLTMAGLNEKDRRNISKFSEDFQVGKGSAHEWLTKDKPPKDSKLDALVTFLLSKLDRKHTANVRRVCAWLKYGGPGGVPNPFNVEKNETLNLARHVLLKCCSKFNISPNASMLDSQLEKISQLIEVLQITSIDELEDSHLEIIKKFVI